MKAWRFLTFVYFAVLIRRRSEEHTSELQSPCNLVCRIIDRKSTRLNSSHLVISYAVFCLKKKKKEINKIDNIVIQESLTMVKNIYILSRQDGTDAITRVT